MTVNWKKVSVNKFPLERLSWQDRRPIASDFNPHTARHLWR